MRQLVVAALLSFLAAVPLTAADPEDAKCATFGYEPDNGPDAWGLMRPEWIACDSGRAQSPIVLDPMTLWGLPPVSVPSAAGPFTIQNTGHEYKVYPLYWATIKRGSTEEATLVQFHFHHPAEHYTSLENRAAMEMHAVYELPNKSAMAVAVFFIEDKNARPNLELQKVIDAKDKLPVCRSRKTPVDMKFNLGALFPSLNRYATYGGSLTTPPCSEPVTFILLLDPIRIPPSQIDALRVGVHDNARNVQPRLGRRIYVRHQTK
jgi:carbonic anhydrase